MLKKSLMNWMHNLRVTFCFHPQSSVAVVSHPTLFLDFLVPSSCPACLHVHPTATYNLLFFSFLPSITSFSLSIIWMTPSQYPSTCHLFGPWGIQKLTCYSLKTEAWKIRPTTFFSYSSYRGASQRLSLWNSTLIKLMAFLSAHGRCQPWVEALSGT